MRFILYFIFGVFGVYSCKTETKPDYTTIDEKKMLTLITEMHLTEGTIKTYSSYNKVIYVKSEFYDSVLVSHGVTPKQFIWNLLQYSKKKKICELYEKSISEITAQKASYEKILLDSLQKKK